MKKAKDCSLPKLDLLNHLTMFHSSTDSSNNLQKRRYHHSFSIEREVTCQTKDIRRQQYGGNNTLLVALYQQRMDLQHAYIRFSRDRLDLLRTAKYSYAASLWQPTCSSSTRRKMQRSTSYILQLCQRSLLYPEQVSALRMLDLAGRRRRLDNGWCLRP